MGAACRPPALFMVVAMMEKLTYQIIENYRSDAKNYPGIGRAMQISNGKYEVIVTLDVGIRIMHFSLVGRPNIFDDDCALIENMPDGRTWYSYGGQRLWHAPEAFPRSYAIDDIPLEKYEITDKGIRMYREIEAESNIQKIVEIEFCEDKLIVYNRLVNRNPWPVELAAWTQTAIADGLMVYPVTQRNSGLLPNTHYVVWPYAKMTDSRAYFGEQFITIVTDSQNADPFKFGYPDEYGWAALFTNGMCFVKKFGFCEKAVYPDRGCNLECYVQDWGAEMEDLSPLQTLQPGQMCEHKNEWYLFDNVSCPKPKDEAEIFRVLCPMIESVGLEMPERK